VVEVKSRGAELVSCSDDSGVFDFHQKRKQKLLLVESSLALTYIKKEEVVFL